MEGDGNIVIAATSDIHGHLEGIEQVCRDNKADVLVISGDIEPADMFTSKPYWFTRKFFPLMEDLGCEVVAIPGNHDFYLSSHYQSIKNGEDRSVPKNFHILVDESIDIRGLKFYGTPWVPFIDGRWCFEKDDEDLTDYFKMIPQDADVLVAHTPPRIRYSNLDVSLDNRRHVPFGSKSLTEAIESKLPHIVFCGHIHSGYHDEVFLPTPNGKTGSHIWNVSRVNEQYQIAYKIRIVKVASNGKVVETMPLPYDSIKKECPENGDI